MPETKVNVPPNRTIYGARLLFRNFAGRKQQFNEEGNRNFCIILEPDVADEMVAEGWNVKSLRVRDEGDEPERYVQVKVNFDSERPPKVVLMAGDNRLPLGPDEVSTLDYADLANVDVTLNPYPYAFNGNSGITAYLKTAFLTLNQDELEMKYEDSGQMALPMTTMIEDDSESGILDLSEFDTSVDV